MWFTLLVAHTYVFAQIFACNKTSHGHRIDERLRLNMEHGRLYGRETEK